MREVVWKTLAVQKATVIERTDGPASCEEIIYDQDKPGKLYINRAWCGGLDDLVWYTTVFFRNQDGISGTMDRVVL